MDAALKTRWICDQARAIGFDLCGVAPIHGAAGHLDELHHLPDWLQRGNAGEMNYLHDPRRAHPSLAMDGARSLIVVALNYNSSEPYSTSTEAAAANPDGSPRGWISRYAWGDDYHETMWQKLNSLVANMHTEWPEPFAARAYVDTGPVIERVAAKYAGRISYLTIELRTAIPEDLRPAMGNAVIGCDICQDVCPWNRKSPFTTLAAFQPRAAAPPENGKEKIENGHKQTLAAARLFAPELEWLVSLTQQEFSTVFRGSAIKRAKWRGLLRNACVALGNSQIPRDAAAFPRVLTHLENLAASSDELIAEHAQWALSRLKN